MLRFRFVRGADFPDQLAQIDRAPLHRPTSSIQPGDVQQERGALDVDIDDVADSLETRHQDLQPIAFRDSERCHDLQEQGVHRIAEFVRGDRKQIVACEDLHSKVLHFLLKVLHFGRRHRAVRGSQIAEAFIHSS